MRYIVEKTNEINPGVDSKEWDKANLGYVDKNRWTDGLYKSPETTFKLLRGPEGLSVLMHTNEEILRSEIKEENGMVCTDSCMEFFYKPSPWDPRYFNFEMNPDGVMFISIGTHRYDRTLIFEDRKTFDIVTNAKNGDWTIKYYIPDNFVNQWFSDLPKMTNGNSSNIARGNFYKCGEQTVKPHLASWAEVEVEIGDFHTPDFFGKLVF